MDTLFKELAMGIAIRLTACYYSHLSSSRVSVLLSSPAQDYVGEGLQESYRKSA